MPDDAAPAKVRKSGIAAVEAALAEIEVATVDECRAGFTELHKLLDRAGASEMLTAARDRVNDALQFVHAHFGVKA